MSITQIRRRGKRRRPWISARVEEIVARVVMLAGIVLATAAVTVWVALVRIEVGS